MPKSAFIIFIFIFFSFGYSQDMKASTEEIANQVRQREADLIEVLPSGKLALSIGIVFAKDKLVSKFSSTWRLEQDGVWRAVFDHGFKVCE